MNKWNELFEQGEFRWENPDENIVALVAELKEKGVRRILDLACGAGRHLVYFARGGFEMYGMDIAGNALASAQGWLAREGLKAELTQSEMTIIPYPDEFFDVVICIRAIQHQTLEGLQKTRDEIRRVLQAGGLFYATWPSRRDRRYGQGREIEPNTFLSEVGPDIGVPHHYCSLGEIETLLDGFALRRVELEERTNREGYRFSHWLVLAEKE